MELKNIKVNFIGMDPSDALSKSVLEKLERHDYLIDNVTNGEINMIENTSHRGVSHDFKLEITLNVPRTRVHVEETGEDMYNLVDSVTEKVVRMLQRYHDKLQQWEGKKQWVVSESEEQGVTDTADLDEGDFVDYTPKISRRETLTDQAPMEEAEAIERMELRGHLQILFKNKQTGNICMVYKRRDGTYAIVEGVADSV